MVIEKKDGTTETIEEMKFPKWLNDLMAKKWFLYLFAAVVLVLVVGSSLPASTRNELINSVFTKGPSSGDAVNPVVIATGTATPHPTPSATEGAATPTPGQEKTQNAGVYDIFGRKVNPEDVVIIGKISNTPDLLKQPPRLVREGLMDIQVRFVSTTQTINVIVNKIPDSSKKLTYLRVKLYDENGLVLFNTEAGTRDYLKDILLSKNSEVAGEAGLVIYDDQLSRPLKGVTEMYLMVYFTEPAPAFESAKAIKI